MSRSKWSKSEAGGLWIPEPSRRSVVQGVSAGAAAALLLGCGESGSGSPAATTNPGRDPDQGGMGSKGGAPGSGGSKAGSGGASPAGGTGGASSSGGATGNGGAPAGTGGATSGSGGAGSGGSSGGDAGEFPNDARIEVGRPEGMADVATMACVDTDPNDEGPFYMAGAPMRDILADKADGEWLIVTGRVLNTKCQPLANAIVDVWHSNGAADGKSVYDNQRGGMYKWRGKVATDADGNYKYETVRPGRYNNGGRLRPCHIHYKISAAGHGTLTTQFQPKGDPYFDGIALHSLDVPFVKEGMIWKSTINIVLRAGKSAELEQPTRKVRLATATKLPRRSFFFLGGRKA